MFPLTIISHYYNFHEKVDRQIQHWANIAPSLRDFVEFVIVDDCSDSPLMLDTAGLHLRHFRITTDICWNQGGARNLAAFHATGKWLLFFDIDQQLHLDTVAPLLATLEQLDRRTMYSFLVEDNPSQSHPNTFLVNAREFRLHGMYDEDFAGHYGYEDLYLPKVWEHAGGKRALLGNRPFFKELGFMTEKLNRDASRNHALAIFKMSTGIRNSPGVLRFAWEEVPPATELHHQT